MICKLKTFGLALVAVLAMSALVASSASATVAPFWFNSDGDWTVLKGSQGIPSDQFETDGIGGVPSGVVTCGTTKYKGSTSATTAKIITLEPEYSWCTMEPFGSAEVHMNGCKYVFHAGLSTAGSPTEFDVETTVIECPTGKEITITASIAGVSKCVVHIEPQNLGTGVAVTIGLAGGALDLKAQMSFFSRIKYTQTAGTGAGKCTTTSTTSNGSYTGSATIQGENTIGQSTNIWVE